MVWACKPMQFIMIIWLGYLTLMPGHHFIVINVIVMFNFSVIFPQLPRMVGHSRIVCVIKWYYGYSYLNNRDI